MNKQNRTKVALKAVREEILTEYKQMFQHLVKTHRELSADDLRLEVMSVITQHTLIRSKERLRRKVRDKIVRVPIIIDPQESKEAELISW